MGPPPSHLSISPATVSNHRSTSVVCEDTVLYTDIPSITITEYVGTLNKTKAGKTRAWMDNQKSDTSKLASMHRRPEGSTLSLAERFDAEVRKNLIKIIHTPNGRKIAQTYLIYHPWGPNPREYLSRGSNMTTVEVCPASVPQLYHPQHRTIMPAFGCMPGPERTKKSSSFLKTTNTRKSAEHIVGNLGLKPPRMSGSTKRQTSRKCKRPKVAFYKDVMIFETKNGNRDDELGIVSTEQTKDGCESYIITLTETLNTIDQIRGNVQKFLQTSNNSPYNAKLIQAAWIECLIKHPTDHHVHFAPGSRRGHIFQPTYAIMYILQSAHGISEASQITSNIATAPVITNGTEFTRSPTSPRACVSRTPGICQKIRWKCCDLSLFRAHLTTAQAAAREKYLTRYRCPCCMPLVGPVETSTGSVLGVWKLRQLLTKRFWRDRSAPRLKGASVEMGKDGKTLRIMGLTAAGERFEIN